MTRETDLCFLSACELVGLIRARRVSATEVLEAHLAQVERVNPRVNAIVTLVADRARERARTVDAALARGDDPGPLAGLPVAHKDLVPTRGVRTTQGSPIFREFVPDRDALLVERIRDAGAVLVGKTNTPEFGAGSQTFNPVFGATRNPYAPDRTCGGSSGGAAVALSCGLVAVADGSDLGGSLRNPASFCNVVGLRPSPGRVPDWPSELGWCSLPVSGPMGRTVADAALLLSVMAGPDPRAPLSIAEPGRRFREPLDRDFTGVRVAWSRDLGGLPIDPAIVSTLEPARRRLETLGCLVTDAEPDLAEADLVFKVLRAWIFEATLGRLLDTHRDQLKDTVIWNIEEGRKLGGADVGRAEVARTRLVERVAGFMASYEFLALPVTQVPPFPIDQPYVTEIAGTRLSTYIDWMRSCYFISVLGLPAISVPAGFTPDGLPVGLQIVGRRLDDWGVLQIAHAFEQGSGAGRQRPPLAAAAAG